MVEASDELLNGKPRVGSFELTSSFSRRGEC